MEYIYKIYNTENEKIYIGQTINSLNSRLTNHKSAAKCYNYKSKLYEAMNEIGPEKFFIELLEEVSDKLLNKREQFYINQFNTIKNGYNIVLGGDGPKSIPSYEETNIVISFLRGYPIQHLAREYNHTWGTIKNLLKRNGINYINNIAAENNISSADSIVETFLIYKSINQTAKLHKVCKETVRKILRKEGIKWKSSLKKKVKINESGLIFDSITDLAKFLIQKNYCKSNNIESVRSRIKKQLNGSCKTYLGFTFQVIDE